MNIQWSDYRNDQADKSIASVDLQLDIVHSLHKLQLASMDFYKNRFHISYRFHNRCLLRIQIWYNPVLVHLDSHLGISIPRDALILDKLRLHHMCLQNMDPNIALLRTIYPTNSPNYFYSQQYKLHFDIIDLPNSSLDCIYFDIYQSNKLVRMSIANQCYNFPHNTVLIHHIDTMNYNVAMAMCSPTMGFQENHSDNYIERHD